MQSKSLWIICLFGLLIFFSDSCKEKTSQEGVSKLAKAKNKMENNNDIQIRHIKFYSARESYDKLVANLTVFSMIDVSYHIEYSHAGSGSDSDSLWQPCGFDDADVDLPIKFSNKSGNCLGEASRKLTVGDRSTIYIIYIKGSCLFTIAATCHCNDITKDPKFKNFLLVMKDIGDQVEK
jgi:hypothetical protein